MACEAGGSDLIRLAHTINETWVHTKSASGVPKFDENEQLQQALVAANLQYIYYFKGLDKLNTIQRPALPLSERKQRDTVTIALWHMHPKPTHPGYPRKKGLVLRHIWIDNDIACLGLVRAAQFVTLIPTLKAVVVEIQVSPVPGPFGI